jgi:hypothetical protein
MEPSVNLLVAALHRHPAIVVLAVVVAVSLVLSAIDLFVAASEREDGLATLLRQAWCRARFGHEFVAVFEQRRIGLRCPNCAHETPGWVIGGRPPRVRYEGDSRRHFVPARLVVRRSV